MAESSIFWATTGTGDGDAGGYSAAELFDLFRALFTGATANAGGVAPDYSNELAVSGTTSPVSVAAGAAVVYGIPYFSGAAVTVAVPTPSTATRIDRIVLRAAWAAQTVRITRIAGTEGAGSAPAMTQSAGTTWDIPLANVSITTGGAITVTDAREFLQNLGDGGITTAKLADNAVTNAKMADASVNTAELVDAGVTLAKMANLAESRLVGRAAAAGTGVPTALTPAQLITILLAADGTSSLLDADKLDGQEGNYYALYSANNPSVDPNTTTDPYILSNHANVPGGSGYWHIITARYAALGIAQIAMRYDSTINPAMYYRNNLSGTWSSWMAVVTTVGATFTGGLTINGASGIGGAAATSTILTLTSTTGALLIPRMTTTQRNAMTAANGMVIYNTTTATLQAYQGGAWVSMGSDPDLTWASVTTYTPYSAQTPAPSYRVVNGMAELSGRISRTGNQSASAAASVPVPKGGTIYLPIVASGDSVAVTCSINSSGYLYINDTSSSTKIYTLDGITYPTA